MARRPAAARGVALTITALLVVACAALPGAVDVAEHGLAEPDVVEHFVDGGRTANGDGESWASAWPSFAAIDWTAIGPGDVLTISGGPTGRVYRETLVVAASGGEHRPVTIRAATAPGHAGGVVIDAEDQRANGVVVEGHDHVVIQDLSVRNVGDAGVRVRDARAGVLIEGVGVDAGNALGTGNARGFDVRDSRGVVLRHNRYTTPTLSPAQNDGIFSMRNSDVRYFGNRLIMRNNFQGPDEGHNDCIQSYLDHDLEIVGNYCEQRNWKTGHSLGIFVQNISGTALVADNVVVSPNTRSACIAVENLPDFPTSGRMLAYHNTAYGCAYGTLHIVRSPRSVAHNNILVSPGADAQALKVVPPLPPPESIDHNLLFAPHSLSPVFIGGSGAISWDSWRERGYEAHGVEGDPGFVDLAARDLGPRPGSIAIGRAGRLAAVAAGGPSALPSGADLGAIEPGRMLPDGGVAPPRLTH